MKKLNILLLFVCLFSYGASWSSGVVPIDPWIQHAQQVIQDTYGDKVHIEQKNKDLLKFGRNQDVETEIATLMTLPDTVDNETYVSSNIITRIVSSSAADTEAVKIEGHTISGSDFTFSVQSATLTGQTPVSLDTLLARVTRVYNNDSTNLTGTIYVTQEDSFVSGVPQTDSKVHLMVRSGENQSEKASTTLSSSDYWVISSFYCDLLTKSSSFAEVDLEVRNFGKVFRPVASISCSDSHRGVFEFKPYLIIPPNSDVRLRGISDSATGRDVSGGIEGVLLK